MGGYCSVSRSCSVINQARKYPPGIYGPPPRPVHARPGLTRLVAAPEHPCPGLTRPIFIGRVNNARSRYMVVPLETHGVPYEKPTHRNFTIHSCCTVESG